VRGEKEEEMFACNANTHLTIGLPNHPIRATWIRVMEQILGLTNNKNDRPKKK